ncbi:MAG: hypothetical protein QM765_02785 [Myxococcales bacterium]
MRFVGRHPGDLPAPFADFAAHGRCDTRLEVRDEPCRPGPWGTRLCQTDVWRLSSRGRRLRLECSVRTLDTGRPFLQADLDSDWSAGVLRLDPATCPDGIRAAPVTSTLGERDRLPS